MGGEVENRVIRKEKSRVKFLGFEPIKKEGQSNRKSLRNHSERVESIERKTGEVKFENDEDRGKIILLRLS